jgi:hypothetical protein
MVFFHSNQALLQQEEELLSGISDKLDKMSSKKVERVILANIKKESF